MIALPTKISKRIMKSPATIENAVSKIMAFCKVTTDEEDCNIDSGYRCDTAR